MEKKVICNCCGREIPQVQEGIWEDFLHIKKEWGYFSGKDGKLQEFCVCEECYERWISQFRLPVTETEVTELV